MEVIGLLASLIPRIYFVTSLPLCVLEIDVQISLSAG